MFLISLLPEKWFFLARGPLTFPGWYPRDHKPGPYPETDEERRAAAIRSGEFSIELNSSPILVKLVKM